MWEINIGDSIIRKINEGLKDACYLILCYSKEGIDSPWISSEWMSALTRQLNGYGITLLPVMLSTGSPPAILSDIKYADLSKNWDKGINVWD